MRRFALVFAAFLLVTIAVACGDSFPRDIHYGTDAGSDFQPPMWDAAGTGLDAPAGDAIDLDAGSD